MDCLVDTNAVIHSVMPSDPKYAATQKALTTMMGRGDRLYITPQILVEFRYVATRPTTKNGLGQTVAWAQVQTAGLKVLFDFLPEEPEIFDEWEKLVDTHSVTGVNVFDARLVAVMIAYGITHILTFNGKDFAYPGITAVDPNSV